MSTTRPARRRLPALALSLALAGPLVGCSAASAEQAPTGTTDAEGTAGGPLEVTVTDDPRSTLVAHVEVSAPTATDVVLEVAAEGVAPRTIESRGAATTHEFTVVGLRAETGYTFGASGPGDEAPAPGSGSMTTGALPGNAPSAEVVAAAGGAGPSSDEGITFFGLTAPGTYDDPGDMPEGPVFYGVDPQGEVVWYLDSDEETNRAPLVRDAGDGTLLAFFEDTIDRVTLAGEVVETYDMGEVEGWHHDASLLPDGGILALGAETRKIGGRDVHGDVVVELDGDGDVVSEWKMLDHLDPDRFPGPLSKALATEGGLDWSHSNSVVLDEGTGEVVVSVRSQNWVVAHDRASGDVTWVAGDDRGADPALDLPFLELEEGTWSSGQHAATFTDDGRLLVYDNRNETGGEQDDSRAVAYEVDRGAMSARQVFEAVAPKYTMALGDVDELPGGDVLVTAGGPGSGGTDDTARIVEVDQQGEAVWDLSIPDTLVYRSERVPWSEVDRAQG